MRILIAIALGFLFHETAAQDKIYNIKPGEMIADVLKKEDLYLYPSFQFGRVTFKSSETAAGRMNLSFLTGELHFIDNKGDTLALANEQTIREIAIGKDTFYFDEAYLKQVVSGTDWKLAKKQQISMVKQDKAGAYDQGMPSAAVSYTSIRVGNQLTNDLIVREHTTLMNQTEYFIGDKFNQFMMVNKKNLMKLFGKQEKKLETYLVENPVNFKKEEDVRRLFAFLQSL